MAIASTVSESAIDNGGNIKIDTQSLSLTNGAQIGTFVEETSDGLSGGRGNADRISLKASDRVSISNNSLISSNVEGANAVGNLGTISIEANKEQMGGRSQEQQFWSTRLAASKVH